MPPRRANFGGQLSGSQGSSTPAPHRSHASPAAPSGAPTPHSNGSGQIQGIILPQAVVLESLEDPDSEEEVCHICAEPIKYYSVGVCNHRTCHVCALRLRALYKKNACTICKTECPDVIFTTSPSLPYEEIAPSDFKDDRLNIVFENADMMEDSLLLLRFNCPSKQCDYIASGWQDLRVHVRVAHKTELCDICIRFKKIFSHELELYPSQLLQHHNPSILERNQKLPPLPRGMEITNEMGTHPMCGFCHRGFYGADELRQHFKETHEDCFLCKRAGIQDLYFQNYAKVEEHFRTDHFPCYAASCLEKKFVVFSSDMDLKVHQVSEHADQMSARDLALARRIEVQMSFEDVQVNGNRNNPSNWSTPNQGGRGGRGGGGGGRGGPPAGRGGASSSMHGGREMAPHQAQASGSRSATPVGEVGGRRSGFAGGLTMDDPSSSRATGNGGQQQQQQARPSLVGPMTGGEDPDRETMARHAALLSRVSMLVNHSEAKLAVFRSVVSSFRSGQNGSRDVIDTIYNVLGRDVKSTVMVVKSVESLLTGVDQEKRTELLNAITSWGIAKTNEFPSLEALGSSPNYAGITTGRVIDVKKTTSRAGHSGQVWDRVERAASATSGSSNGNAHAGPSSRPAPPRPTFPSLRESAPSSSRAAPPSRHVPGSTAWASSQASSAPSGPAFPPPVPFAAPPRQRPVPMSVHVSSSPSSSRTSAVPRPAKPVSESAFPSLPTGTDASRAAEERRALFANPSKRTETIQRIQGMKKEAPAPVWGAGPSGSGSGSSSAAGSSSGAGGGGGGAGGGGGGKKKSKKGELLFSISARPN
ncbi:hypothetical protein BDY24DRAFT_437416 [Mrakia frigida]|uniref:E3 ubiquitin-protein ligase HEL2 n=1 Tax=Mrakia frigida TaxID=29902 RepID=UPI003FCC1E71